MDIIGNIYTATKFYIKSEEKGALWVSDIDVAKSYIEDPRNLDWYNKQLYCTNEKIIKAKDNKYYLESELPEIIELNKQTIEKIIFEFKNQCLMYVTTQLENFAINHKYTSVENMISFYHSKIKQFSDDAKVMINYRDKLYTFTYDLFKKLETNTPTTLDIEEYYNEFLDNFPKE